MIRADEVDDVIKAGNGSVNDTPSIQARETVFGPKMITPI